MTNVNDKQTIYFSHSWGPRDVDLNKLVWSKLAGFCELLVDAPDEAGPNPPYYINRIEDLLRQSDIFVCVLTERDNRIGEENLEGALQCSPYSLFEIRLAERFDIPRLILYERSTGFKSPRVPRNKEAYIRFDRGSKDKCPDDRFWRRMVEPVLDKWIEWAKEYNNPYSVDMYSLAVNLYPFDKPDSMEVSRILQETLEKSGYERVAIDAAFRSNIELYQLLRVTGLVIMEYGVETTLTRELNAAIHSLCIPTIRMIRGNGTLPWLLQGHPGGYQNDIVRWNDPSELPGLVGPRARAMFRVNHAKADEEAYRYLESKRFSLANIFLSHTLKPPHRDLVEQIYKRLDKHFVKPFEYHMVNESGSDWKKQLDQHLNKTTHFVVLLTEGYELSEICTYELEFILNRGDAVKILPFMALGRSQPHPKLKNLHHKQLSGKVSDIEKDAELVEEGIMNVLSSE